MADMSDLEVAIILMSLQLAKDTWWLPSLLSSPSLDTVDTALSSWPRSTPRKEHRSFLVIELQTKVHMKILQLWRWRRPLLATRAFS